LLRDSMYRLGTAKRQRRRLLVLPDHKSRPLAHDRWKLRLWHRNLRTALNRPQLRDCRHLRVEGAAEPLVPLKVLRYVCGAAGIRFSDHGSRNERLNPERHHPNPVPARRRTSHGYGKKSMTGEKRLTDSDNEVERRSIGIHSDRHDCGSNKRRL